MHLLWLIALITTIFTSPVLAGGEADTWVDVYNESNQKIKVVAPGGVGFVDANSGPVRITFKTEEHNGDTFIGWWTKNPRQMCKIYVRWGGKLYFNGTSEIRCRAH